jgi:hypothetical protein
LLKDSGLDRTTFVVPYLIYKLTMRLDKICSKRHDKNKNFFPSMNHETTFCSKYNYKKYENTNFNFEYKKYYLSISLWDNFVMSFTILFCTVLFCQILNVLRIKRTLISWLRRCLPWTQFHLFFRWSNWQSYDNKQWYISVKK